MTFISSGLVSFVVSISLNGGPLQLASQILPHPSTQRWTKSQCWSTVGRPVSFPDLVSCENDKSCSPTQRESLLRSKSIQRKWSWEMREIYFGDYVVEAFGVLKVSANISHLFCPELHSLASSARWNGSYHLCTREYWLIPSRVPVSRKWERHWPEDLTIVSTQ